jgi:hypothetical protein
MRVGDRGGIAKEQPDLNMAIARGITFMDNGWD